LSLLEDRPFWSPRNRPATAPIWGRDDPRSGPHCEFQLQFEAITRLDPDEESALRSVIEGMLIKHEARRWQTAKA
jgi:hypothetical protein